MGFFTFIYSSKSYLFNIYCVFILFMWKTIITFTVHKITINLKIKKMKDLQIIIRNSKFKIIKKLNTKLELDKYILKNPDTNADNIEINDFCFLGFDEIDSFFNSKNNFIYSY